MPKGVAMREPNYVWISTVINLVVAESDKKSNMLCSLECNSYSFFIFLFLFVLTRMSSLSNVIFNDYVYWKVGKV